MEVHQLEYFCMISKLGNFTRAAEILHVSQPSVTKAIKTLEAELNVILIDRSQKHITLTREGQVFLVHAEKITGAINDALQDMSKFQANEQGILKLGIPPMIEGYVFPAIFTGFKKQYPNITLQIFEYDSSMQVQMNLEKGEIDLGIILGDQNERPNSLLIMQDQINLCVHHAHPLRSEISVHFRQLKDEVFILHHPNTYQYKTIYANCIENGFVPNILLCTAQLKTIKQLVANKAGIALLLNLVTHEEKNFSVVPIMPPTYMNMLMIWSSSRHLSHTSQNFIDFVRAYIQSPVFKSLINNQDKST